MLRGHGDDGYAQPTEIKHDFSSNVCREALPEGLLEHLRQGLEGLSHYPEPASESLRATIARREGVTPASVLVTNGATEAIYLAAQAFPKSVSYVLQPTFSEYADACRLYGHQLRSIRRLDEVGEDASMVWLCTSVFDSESPRPGMLKLASTFSAGASDRCFWISTYRFVAPPAPSP